jgi:spore germination protein YaaH
LGIPVYGYSWPQNSNDKAKDLTYQDTEKILQDKNISPNWDDTAKTPYFEYQTNGKNYKVWYENAKSIEEKIKLAKESGFAGVNLWRLGEEDPAIWRNLPNLK